MRFFKYGLLLLAAGLLTLTGCNSLKTLNGYDSLKHVEIPENFKERLPETVTLHVPLIWQGDNYSCATTSLAMVMSYYDKTRYIKSNVWKASGSLISDIRQYGNDMSGLKRAAKSYGFTQYEFTMLDTDKVKYLLSKGIPVIVNVRNFFKNSSHAVVINGYDNEAFFIKDPAYGDLQKSYQFFNSRWFADLSSPRGKISRSAFIVYPK